MIDTNTEGISDGNDEHTKVIITFRKGEVRFNEYRFHITELVTQIK